MRHGRLREFRPQGFNGQGALILHRISFAIDEDPVLIAIKLSTSLFVIKGCGVLVVIFCDTTDV